MCKFLDKHNILYESQFGFCSKHCCEQAIIELVGKLLQVREQGDHVVGNFLDLFKAFDTLNHEVLLLKLERYGIRGNVLNWFKSYLHKRSLVANVATSVNTITYSETYNITCGMAHGSCLGPLLFILLLCNADNSVFLFPMVNLHKRLVNIN